MSMNDRDESEREAFLFDSMQEHISKCRACLEMMQGEINAMRKRAIPMDVEKLVDTWNVATASARGAVAILDHLRQIAQQE